MGSLFNFILVLIFFYLIYQLFIRRLFTPSDPYKGKNEDDIHTENHVNEKEDVEKKIDMSKVEDADYKELD